jgi:hypothetical protein
MKKNKKGISLMVSYVLLIIIAVGISVGVFAYLKLYLPTEQPECPYGTSLIISYAKCNSGTLTLNITNNGLRNVTGAFIRMAHSNRTVRDQINQGNEFFSPPLAPGTTIELPPYPTVPNPASGTYVIEIQPATISGGWPFPCDSSTIVSQEVICIS